VLKTIEDQVNSGGKTAMEIYRENISDHSIPGIQQGVLNARNVKQVENIVGKVNEQKRISKDDIYNLVLLAYHMEGYIHEVTVFPDLTAVIALPEMISLVNQLLDVTTADVPVYIFNLSVGQYKLFLIISIYMTFHYYKKFGSFL